MAARFDIRGTVLARAPLIVIYGQLLEGEITDTDIIEVQRNDDQIWETCICGIRYEYRSVAVANADDKPSHLELAIVISHNGEDRRAAVESIKIGSIAELTHQYF